MKKSPIFLIILVALAGFIVFWYLASPLFIDTRVNEGNPIERTISSSGGSVDFPPDTQARLYSGVFSGADSFHKISGEALIISDGDTKYLRLENFESTNGPDLKVYLSGDSNAKDYVSLGDLKGNIGSQNYEIPEDVDLGKYNKVLIWCEAFSVLFGSAELM